MTTPADRRSARAGGSMGVTTSVALALLILSTLGPVRPAVGAATGASDAGAAWDYVIVVSKRTARDPGWGAVVEALRKKYDAVVVHWSGKGTGKLGERLSAAGPRYVCFVSRPSELAQKARVRLRSEEGREKEFPLYGTWYHKVAEVMASLDADPYDDARWAVLTGETAEDALRVASCEPLQVRRGLSHVTSGWLKWLESGVSFSETRKGRKWVKRPGEPPEKCRGPGDTTAQFVAELNADASDMVSTSGHATEDDWQMGYNYRSGQIVTPSRFASLPWGPEAAPADENTETPRERPDGPEPGEQGAVAPALMAVDSENRAYEILTANPKVYYSPGNCRIAHVDGPGCMALGWIHHGAMQFFGHVGLQMHSCYAWGVAEYFLALQGRYTFAEAVWLNQQALRWQLSRMSKDERKKTYVCCQNARFVRAGKAFYWETTVLYGDPAWEARVKPVTEPLYDQRMARKPLGEGREQLTFTVTMRRPEKPKRPAAFFLEPAVRTLVEVKEGPGAPVIADDFALIPFWPDEDSAPAVGKTYRAVVIAEVAAEHAATQD